jgi:hypothetical protein
MSPNPCFIVCDKPRLLLALLEKFAGDARVSFEGDLRGFNLLALPGANENQTAILKRNTLWPMQDFVVVPLALSGGQSILSAISGAVPHRILHVQIESKGVLQFVSYDNFNPECLVWGPEIGSDFLDSLVAEGILKFH